MKKLFGVVALALVGAACQQEAGTLVASEKEAIAKKQLTTSQPALAQQSPLRLVASDSLSPAMRTFARRHDLSAVWQGQEEKENQADNSKPTVCEGFFGADHYHIELVMLRIIRDKNDPLLYHVQGKGHYNKRITSFAGDIRLQRLHLVSIQNFVAELQGRFAQFYTAKGEFEFREFGATDAGTFTGTIGIDFQQQADSTLTLTYFWGDEHRQYANGAKSRLQGEWVSTQTGLRKPMLVGAGLLEISREVLPDFNIGERGFTLNPKYARLGWDEAWQNDEWWADSPKPRLSL